jgi:predicted MPP superfamily phosphohydrolase
MIKKQWSEWLWDAWCITSCIGIWPRYIEPRLLSIKRLTLVLPKFPKDLHGIKILQFSDLHWHAEFPCDFKKKIIRQINSLTPDLIVFSGDFLCRSKLENPEGLKVFLESLKARIGCFAVLGNHDYADFVTVNARGDYDVEDPSRTSTIAKGFKRLFSTTVLTKKVSDKARLVEKHEELIKLLEQTPFQLLNNTNKMITYNGQWMNICGLEEYSLGRCLPSLAFKNYDVKYPGIILSHNPDAFSRLKHYPGDLLLSGHTHGGQVNLPWLWKRFTRLENMEFKSGLKQLSGKFAYINRGISSVMKFRWFAPPELTLITLLGPKN